jgi:hypothetical protein
VPAGTRLKGDTLKLETYNLFVGGITLIKDLCIKYQIRSNI